MNVIEKEVEPTVMIVIRDVIARVDRGEMEARDAFNYIKGAMNYHDKAWDQVQEDLGGKNGKE